MTAGGWVVMILSVGGVTLFFGWTLFLVFTRNSATEHMHSTMEETPDIEENEP